MSQTTMEANKQSEISKIFKDLFAGTVAGFAGIAATHPIDTIRIRMQLQTYPKIYKTGFHCGMKAIEREGIRGLFKGVLSNSWGSSPIYSVGFAANAFAERMIAPLKISDGWKAYLCGGFAGFVGGVTTVPAEMLKCRAQADKWSFMNYTSTVKSIWQQKGIRGIYQGWGVTCLRDIPGCGFYFFTYRTLCKNLINESDSNRRKYTIKVIAGGLAGIMDWVPTYPFDVVKTKIQGDKSLKTPSILSVMKTYYQQQGARFFFKGILPTGCLAFPMNAIIFVVYDEIIDLLGGESE